MATIPALSIEEYLNTDYEGAVEYVDGELKEKGVTGFSHGTVQLLLGQWFLEHRRDWGAEAHHC